MVEIGACKLICSLINIFLLLGLASFFTYSFITLPNDIKGTTSSILFAIFIVMYWLDILPQLKQLYLIVRHYGETIEDNIWKTLNTKSKIFNLISFIGFGISFYFMIVIGPFFKSCGIYQNTHSACTSVQIIALFGFIQTCGIGICIVFLLLMVIALVYLECNNHHSGDNIRSANTLNHRNNPFMVSATAFLEAYNPIPIPESDTKCLVCLETVEESPDKQWTKLKCNHSFHRLCVAEWCKYSLECPHCRTTITISSSVDV